jgi:hypothetical protein
MGSPSPVCLVLSTLLPWRSHTLNFAYLFVYLSPHQHGLPHLNDLIKLESISHRHIGISATVYGQHGHTARDAAACLAHICVQAVLEVSLPEVPSEAAPAAAVAPHFNLQ